MWVFNKEHVADEPHQPVANPQAALVAPLGKLHRHLTLRVVVRLQVVQAVSLAYQEVVTHVLGMDAKEALHQPVVDERTCEQFLAERQSEVFYLVYRQGQCRREVSQQAVDSILGNLPDAEEAQHVVYAEGVKVLLHVTEAPPHHLIQLLRPMIGGEAPVLSLLREGVRWGARQRVEIEELRMPAGFHAVPVDADGQVALQHDPLLAGIVGSSLQLGVQQVLLEVDFRELR